MKKIILLLVTFCMLLTASACEKKVKNRTYDEAEVLAAAEELIEKSVLFNRIYYGEGIPVKLDNPKTSGGYVEADPAFLTENGITSLDLLREKTEEVYTKATTAYIFNTVLGVIYSGDNIVGYKRYIEDAGTVYVSTDEERNNYRDTAAVTYHYDTLAVDHVKGEIIFVTVLVTAENAAGETRSRTIDIRLLEEENGFRLDCNTYFTYFANEK